jgi:hypothetical protein
VTGSCPRPRASPPLAAAGARRGASWAGPRQALFPVRVRPPPAASRRTRRLRRGPAASSADRGTSRRATCQGLWCG